jgi:4-amino-4-deoxy-L-arabinose transferase-like glycosyltransferase
MPFSSLLSIIRRAVTSRVFVFVLIAVAFAVTSGGRLRESPDATFYLELSNAASSGRLSTFVTSTQANFTVIVLPALIALARMISPGRWQLIMLAINILSAATTGVLLVGLVHRVTASVTATAAALLFYLTCYDVFSWTWLLLTDNIYACLALLVFVLVVRGITGTEESKRSRRVKLLIAMVVAAITRPVGFFVIPLVIAAEWFYIERQPKRSRVLWIVFASGVVVAFLTHAYFFQDMRRWPTHFLRPKLEEYAAREKSGEVVWGRHDTSQKPPLTMTDHVSIEVNRFARFFQVTTPGNSRKHNAMALAYYIPLYLLALAGVVAAMQGGDDRRQAVVEVTLLWILSMAALSGATVLDYDWRYRMPLMPQLILLAACGVDALMRWYAVREQPPVTARSTSAR